MTLAAGIATQHPIADAVRILLILLPGAAIGAITALVLVRYWRVYRTMMAVEGDWLGLLPKHVVLIGSSYLVLIGYAIVDTCGHFHQPLGARPFIYGAAFLLGVAALWSLLGYERARKHRL